MATRSRQRTVWVPGRPWDGVLLQLRVDSERWAELIPPVPAGHDVTAALSAAAFGGGHADALELLGYRLVGAGQEAVPGDHEAVVELLVPQALIDAHPRWWEAMRQRAERLWCLMLGPVAAVLAERLRVHLEPLRS